MKNTVCLIFVLLGFFNARSFAQSYCSCSTLDNKAIRKIEGQIGMGKFEEVLQAIEEKKKDADPCCQAIAFTLEAVAFNTQNKSPESYSSAAKALDALKQIRNTYVEVEANRMTGLFFLKKGNADSAQLFYLKALEAAVNTKEYILEARVQSSIAAAYSQREQEEKALEHQKQAVRAAYLSKDTLAISQSLSNLATVYGRVYDETEDKIYLDSSATAAMEAAPYIKASGNRNFLFRNYLTLEKFEIIKENFVLAMSYSDTLASLMSEKTNPLFRLSYYIDRGNILIGMKQYDAAIKNLDSAFEITVAVKNSYTERMINDRLYEAYKAKDDPSKALGYLEKFRVLNDSLIDKENSDAINELEAKYNKAQDQQTIKTLGLQKKTYLLLALAGLFALLGLIFFIRQQSLKNKKKILETEQRLNRARMNPHFFFNALSSLQSYALEGNDGKSIASNLSKFSHIMRETLESTYKEYVTIEQETDFLNEYLELQKIRFPQKFSYSITANSNIEPDETVIPSMILQPFAENSIEHGFTGIDYPGEINISFDKKDKDLVIIVSDNGKGLAAMPKENTEHISRASQIIKDRIYLLNIKLKTKASFSIDNNTNGKGVTVVIRLPLLHKEDVKV